MKWVNNTLGIERTPNTIWDERDGFDFKIPPTPQALEEAIRQKAAEHFTAQITAGFLLAVVKTRDRTALWSTT